ncbi:hypothetical protein GCM10023088_32010 [Actinomadura verrucosospora]
MVAETAVSVPTRDIAAPAPAMPRLWEVFMDRTLGRGWSMGQSQSIPPNADQYPLRDVHTAP